jgi:hypothetical protein
MTNEATKIGQSYAFMDLNQFQTFTYSNGQ